MCVMKRIILLSAAFLSVTFAWAQERQPYLISEQVKGFGSVYVHSGCHATLMHGNDNRICIIVENFDSLAMQSACNWEDGALHLLPHPAVSAQQPLRIYSNNENLQVFVEPEASLLVTAQSLLPDQIILYTDVDGRCGKLCYDGDSSQYPAFSKVVSRRSFPEKKPWKFKYISLNLDDALGFLNHNHRYNNPFNTSFAYHLGLSLCLAFGKEGSDFTWFSGLSLDNVSYVMSQQIKLLSTGSNNTSGAFNMVENTEYNQNIRSQQMNAHYLGVPFGFYYKLDGENSISFSINPSYNLWEILSTGFILQSNKTDYQGQKTKIMNPWRFDVQVGFHLSNFYFPEVGFRANLLPVYRRTLTEKPMHEFSIYLKM